jgi:hypothetical protein
MTSSCLSDGFLFSSDFWTDGAIEKVIGYWTFIREIDPQKGH